VLASIALHHQSPDSGLYLEILSDQSDIDLPSKIMSSRIQFPNLTAADDSSADEADPEAFVRRGTHMRRNLSTFDSTNGVSEDAPVALRRVTSPLPRNSAQRNDPGSITLILRNNVRHTIETLENETARLQASIHATAARSAALDEEYERIQDAINDAAAAHEDDPEEQDPVPPREDLFSQYEIDFLVNRHPSTAESAEWIAYLKVAHDDVLPGWNKLLADLHRLISNIKEGPIPWPRLAVIATLFQRMREPCGICLADMTQDLCTTSCLHMACTSCMLTWVMEHLSCPFCRREIFVNHLLEVIDGDLGRQLKIWGQFYVSSQECAAREDVAYVGEGGTRKRRRLC
jgi:hypothetical protein